MNVAKIIKYLTLLTAVLTVLVFVDYYLLGYGLLIVPLTVLSALIASVFAMIKKNYLAILLNVIFVIITVVAFIQFDW